MLLLFCPSISYAVTPEFADPVKIQANGQDINVGYGGNASPFMVDWDGDGNQDLLLGQYDGGKLRFYKILVRTMPPNSVILYTCGLMGQLFK